MFKMRRFCVQPFMPATAYLIANGYIHLLQSSGFVKEGLTNAKLHPYNKISLKGRGGKMTK